MAPQVQQLRELRDNQLLQTESGTAFMGHVNDIYYTFSQLLLIMSVKTHIQRSSQACNYSNDFHIIANGKCESESEVLSIGLSVIALNLGMYLGVPAIVIIGIKKRLTLS